jgi:hypothetical protein
VIDAQPFPLKSLEFPSSCDDKEMTQSRREDGVCPVSCYPEGGSKEMPVYSERELIAFITQLLAILRRQRRDSQDSDIESAIEQNALPPYPADEIARILSAWLLLREPAEIRAMLIAHHHCLLQYDAIALVILLLRETDDPEQAHELTWRRDLLIASRMHGIGAAWERFSSP